MDICHECERALLSFDVPTRDEIYLPMYIWACLYSRRHTYRSKSRTSRSARSRSLLGLDTVRKTQHTISTDRTALETITLPTKWSIIALA